MVRRSAEEWRALFEAQRRSGLSVRAFCKERGVSAESFARHKKATGPAVERGARSPFVRVEAAAEASKPGAGGNLGGALRARLRLGRCEWELGGLGLDDLARLMAALA